MRKQNEQKSNNKINQLQKELEEEKSKNIISYIESNRIENNNENITNNQKEEKAEKENKIIQYDNEHIFKIEYESIKEKYNILLAEQKANENKIKKKEEENEYLNNYIQEMIKKKKEKKMNYKELKYKYRNLLNKKERYKELCKIAKKNVENIIELLTPQQKQQIEQTENKYLIDTDSFSFTEVF